MENMDEYIFESDADTFSVKIRNKIHTASTTAQLDQLVLLIAKHYSINPFAVGNALNELIAPSNENFDDYMRTLIWLENDL